MNYELLIIGNGREAINAAIAAAQRGERVGLVEPTSRTHCGATIEVLRTAAQRMIAAESVSMCALRTEVARIESVQVTGDREQLARLGVDVVSGSVRFLDSTTVEVERPVNHAGQRTVHLAARSILLACGTTSAQPGHLPFDGRQVLTPESLLNLVKLPHSMIIVGAGQTGLDYAILLATLGVEVTVIDENEDVLNLYGGLLGDSRGIEAQSLDIAFRLGDEVIGVETRADARALVRLASGRSIAADAVLVCVGRIGATSDLNLDATGVGIDERGRVWCDATGRTWASNIRAVGDVVGFRTAGALAG